VPGGTWEGRRRLRWGGGEGGWGALWRRGGEEGGERGKGWQWLRGWCQFEVVVTRDAGL